MSSVDNHSLPAIFFQYLVILFQPEAERGQPFGNNATDEFKRLTTGKTIRVESIGQDKYDRELGRVYADEIDVNLSLVVAGLAWHYKRFSDEVALADAENEARTAKRGLWSDPRHVAPWNWRKLNKEERDQLR